MIGIDGEALASAFARLGLTAGADEREVRQAYAKQLKQIDLGTDIQAFQTLREAYELLLKASHSPAAPKTLSITAPSEPRSPDTAALVEATPADLSPELRAGLTSAKDAAALLRATLDRQGSLEAGTRLEQHVADLLAKGWQPGHEHLLDGACTVFRWTSDDRHLRGLGGSGEWLLEALIEKQLFLDQPADVLHRQLRLVHRLRDATAPTPTLLRDERPLLQVLVGRYPHWLNVAAPMAQVEHWLGGADALQDALNKHQPRLVSENEEKQFSDWSVVATVLGIALWAWYRFG